MKLRKPTLRPIRRLLAMVLLLVATDRAPAATVYQDLQEFLTANPGLSLLNFEGIAPPGDSITLPQPQQGITFAGGMNFGSMNPNLVSVADSSPSDVAFVNSNRGWAMRISLGRMYATVGLRVRVFDGGNRQATVSAYNNGVLVAERTLATATDFSTFIGFNESTGIDRVDILAAQDQGNNVLIDDLRFGAPVVNTADVPVPFEWKPVGNAGNPSDNTGFGSVGYNYRIAKYPVTNGQWVEFLNTVAATDPHGLYSEEMDNTPRGGITRSGSSGSYRYAPVEFMANKPVFYVNFYDALRYINWLHNGRGNGSTETGA